MSLTQHIGYGSFQLQDLEPGERFARHDATLAELCREQPFRDLMPNHLRVWNDVDTSNALQIMLHRTAIAYALSQDQAAAIEARQPDRSGEISTTALPHITPSALDYGVRHGWHMISVLAAEADQAAEEGYVRFENRVRDRADKVVMGKRVDDIQSTDPGPQ